MNRSGAAGLAETVLHQFIIGHHHLVAKRLRLDSAANSGVSFKAFPPKKTSFEVGYAFAGLVLDSRWLLGQREISFHAENHFCFVRTDVRTDPYVLPPRHLDHVHG